MSALLWVAMGAAAGAPLRYLTDRATRHLLGAAFPWGTLAVNVVGSFAFGLIVATSASTGRAIEHGAGTGFCGALTTYSSFGYETHQLAEQRHRLLAAANVALTLVVGIGAAIGGYATGSGIW